MPCDDSYEAELIDRYEDAKFTLLMYRAAGAQGEELLAENERLKADPDFKVPSEISAAAGRTIRRTFARENTGRTLRAAGKILSKVAVAVLILNVAFTALFSTASAFRADVLNFVYNTYDIATSVTLDGSRSQPSNNLSSPKLTWLPEGYSLYRTENLGESGFHIEYRNADDYRITFNKLPGNAVSDYDTEDAEIVEKVDILGYDGLYIKKIYDGITSHTVVWGDTDNNYLYSIFTDNVSDADFQKIIGGLVRS